jgi:broad specificity phosphatase PhoE
MIWVMFRHGDKEKLGHDPALSTEGMDQARRILTKVKSGGLPKPTALYVSTKKRTLQTLEPVGQNYGLPAVIKAELTERVPGESQEKFRMRIQEFLVKLMLLHKETDVIYFCTHYDWIDEFLTIIECDSDLTRCTHWPPAQHMVFEKRDLWYLAKYEGV